MDKTILAANVARMQKLALRLEQATVQLQSVFPLDPGIFNPDELPPDVALFLDGFRARFADLQDTIGKTMFKSVAQMDEDETPGRELTTRERTVLMEKRGLIEVDRWHRIREVRNGFAHEYPDEHAEKAATLNLAWDFVPALLDVANAIATYVQRHHGIPSR